MFLNLPDLVAQGTKSPRLLRRGLFVFLATLIQAASPALASIYTSVPVYRLDVGDADEVEKRVREELKKNGDNPLGLHELGTILYRQQRLEQARQLWDQAAALHPDLAVADIEVIFELLQAGDVVGAQTALSSAKQTRSNDPHLYLAIAQVAMSQRDVEGAREAFDQAAKLAPKSSAVILSRGRFRQHVGDGSGARQDFQAAAEMDPTQPAGWLFLAMEDFQQDDIDACLTNLKKAESTRQGEPLSEARLAEFYLQIGDYPGAYSWYSKALRRNPADKLLKARVGQMLTILNRTSEARQFLQSAADDDDFVPALISLAQLEEAAGNLEASAKLMERILAADPDNIIANNNLAMLLAQMKESPDRCLTLAERARKLSSTNPQILSTYGCALVHAGRFAEAAEILRRRVRVEPTDAWLRYFYGIALMKEGQPEAARDQFQACLLLDDKFPRRGEMNEVVTGP